MLQISTPFPQVGSYARLKTAKNRTVRIVQHCRDGRILVSDPTRTRKVKGSLYGKTMPALTRTVDLADLSEAKGAGA